MAFIIGQEFAEVHILKKSEIGLLFFNHIDIFIKFGIRSDLGNK